MTYQISIKPKQEKAVLQLLQSLIEVGLVEAIKPVESLVRRTEPLDEDELLTTLGQRQQEMDEGKSLTHDEVKNFVKVWRSMR
jgi:hypothetical protein